MPEPTRDGVELARTMLAEEGDPLANYLGLIVGRVMRLNYEGLMDIFKDRRDEFEARGAEDLLRKIQADVDNLFSGFINVGEE